MPLSKKVITRLETSSATELLNIGKALQWKVAESIGRVVHLPEDVHLGKQNNRNSKAQRFSSRKHFSLKFPTAKAQIDHLRK